MLTGTKNDLYQNTWEKVADMREERMLPCGAAAHRKIFIARVETKGRLLTLVKCTTSDRMSGSLSGAWSPKGTRAAV